MSSLLAEALGQLNLKPGQTYRTLVNGHEFEVRVLEQPIHDAPEEETSPHDEAVMLHPWFTMPDAPMVGTVQARLAMPPLPDPPAIPANDEDMA
jgi:hypothetical protein